MTDFLFSYIDNNFRYHFQISLTFGTEKRRKRKTLKKKRKKKRCWIVKKNCCKDIY